MPLIGNDIEMNTHQIGGSNFSFKGARIEDLGATEYTLVTIAVDVTGSTQAFAKELREALIAAVEACKKSPRSDNLLLRVITFSTYVGGVNELHGFVPLSGIVTNDYPVFNPDGMTPLYDAAFSAIGALIKYGEDLIAGDFFCNGIVFIITDGADNASSMTPRSIANMIDSAKKNEKLESLVTVLVGINATDCRSHLEDFRSTAKLDQYIDAGEATKGKLAKLAEFVSQSVSSSSQALGTGGPSKQIAASI